MRIRGQETPEPDPRGQRSPRRAPLDGPLVAAVGAPRRRLAPDHRRLRTEGTRTPDLAAITTLETDRSVDLLLCWVAWLDTRP